MICWSSLLTIIINYKAYNLFEISNKNYEEGTSSATQVYYFANKEDIKRSSTTSKHLNIQKPLQPIPQSYKYYVGAGNNTHLIRKIMSARKNW